MSLVRQHEFERPDDVRSNVEKCLALRERLGDQSELEVLEIAQSAVDELAARRGRRPSQVILFAKQRRQAATGGVTGNRSAQQPA